MIKLQGEYRVIKAKHLKVGDCIVMMTEIGTIEAIHYSASCASRKTLIIKECTALAQERHISLDDRDNIVIRDTRTALQRFIDKFKLGGR